MIDFAINELNIGFFNLLLDSIVKFKLAVNDPDVEDFCAMICGGGEL